MHEFIAIKIVSCFPSFEANLCLCNNQDGYRSKTVSKGRFEHLEIAYPERRIEWCKENNLLSSSVSKTCVKTQSVGKDKVHRERNLSFAMPKKKLQWITFKSARTHNFLTVNFP